jgi:glycine dehydrogenase subunit 1
MTSQYVPNETKEVKKNLMRTIGIERTEDLFSDISETIRLTNPLHVPGPLSELEAKRDTEKVLEKNSTVKELVSFLGAGIWSHHVPAVVDAISSRGEFLTSYTPYQPEISQGLLQALFEYQSMMCEFLDVDVANSSMYDWASSLGEAARMAARVTQRKEFLVPHYISPERMAVLKSYAEPAEIKILETKQSPTDGQFDLEDLKEAISENTAAVYIENPSYLGFLIENPDAISEIVHDAKGLFIVGVDPTSLGVLRPPGNYGADIIVGEGQPLGNYMNGGGPLLGIFACKDDDRLVRQMPGRLVGMTTTKDERERAFCMVLRMHACIVCGKNYGLERHHVIPKSKDKDSTLTITLCKRHHRMTYLPHNMNSHFSHFREAKQMCRILNRKVSNYLFHIHFFVLKVKSVPKKY